MAKEKFTLTELKVQSFITSLDPGEMAQLKGGYMTIKGRRAGYRTRWTGVDTRVQMVSSLSAPAHDNQD
ncbi:MAG: pinensin family lanthipeptide [Saprospiraceae bacterium]